MEFTNTYKDPNVVGGKNSAGNEYTSYENRLNSFKEYLEYANMKKEDAEVLYNGRQSLYTTYNWDKKELDKLADELCNLSSEQNSEHLTNIDEMLL